MQWKDEKYAVLLKKIQGIYHFGGVDVNIKMNIGKYVVTVRTR
jgi:hypothetical protein